MSKDLVKLDKSAALSLPSIVSQSCSELTAERNEATESMESTQVKYQDQCSSLDPGTDNLFTQQHQVALEKKRSRSKLSNSAKVDSVYVSLDGLNIVKILLQATLSAMHESNQANTYDPTMKLAGKCLNGPIPYPLPDHFPKYDLGRPVKRIIPKHTDTKVRYIGPLNFIWQSSFISAHTPTR